MMRETIQQKAERLYEWHLYFAWLPVRAQSGDLVWMRSVWRRGWRTLAGWHFVYLTIQEYYAFGRYLDGVRGKQKGRD